MSGVSNIIIRNLTINDARDAIALRTDSSRVGSTTVTSQNAADGLLDITNQSD